MSRQGTRRSLATALAPALVVAVLATVTTGTVLPWAGTVAGATAASVRLAGPTPVLPAGASVLGPSDGSASIAADLSLKPRDPVALSAFVAAVSTPGSPEYRHFLAPGQFLASFGPTEGTIAAARAWLTGEGLQVGTTSHDGLLIPVSGTATQLSRAFSVSLVDTRLASGRVARFSEDAAAVPTSLVGSIQGVLGLSTVAQAEAQLVHGPRNTATSTGTSAAPQVVVTPHTGPGTCGSAVSLGAATGAYTANQVASAYGLSTLYGQGDDGTGQTIGIYELEPYTPSDIVNYENCYGLHNTVTEECPALPIGCATGTQAGEAALDIEDAIGLASGANVIVYSGTNSTQGQVAAYELMVSDDTAKVLSTSWGVCEPLMATSPGQQATESTIFAEAAAQGQTVVAASGDSGSNDCYSPGSNPPDDDTEVAVDDPADQPYVTGVGGTSLLSVGQPPSETVWNSFQGSGGGGVSSDFSQPSWQYGPGVDASAAVAQCAAVGRSSCREVPDVSASADPAHGYAIYFSQDGAGWQAIGGTSGASPVWAATVAVIDQAMGARAGFLNPILYLAGSCASTPFNDVTSGTNAFRPASDGRFAATAHYDVASGWGSPVASRLEAALVSPPTCPQVTGVAPSKGAPSGGGTVTLTGANFYGATGVQFGGTPAFFTVTSGTSIVARVPAGPVGGSTVDVTVTNAQGTSPSVAGDHFTYGVPGYWLVASDGGIFTFGSAGFLGSTGGEPLNKPIVGMAATPDDRGYWLVASDGGIFTFGDAGFYGSTGGMHLNQPIVGMAATPSGHGYWLVASDGGIFTFGDAGFYGSTGGMHLNQPIVGMAATPSGHGYWLVASDGGIFTFGDAVFYGSTGGMHLNQPVVGMAATPSGHGYWLVASDGGIFTFGDAVFYGSTGGMHLNQPMVGMAADLTGHGYWLVARDGGIFALGDSGFYGSEGGTHLNQPVVGMAST